MLPVVYVQVKDERIKLTNEVFSGVKIIKLYAWERSFEAKLRCVREQEMRLLRQYMLTNIGACWTTPFISCQKRLAPCPYCYKMI
jgi:hypothetical protein